MANQIISSRRGRVVIIGLLLALVGTVVPMATMSWVSYHLASQKELSLLSQIAERAVFRARTTFQDARQVMEVMIHADLPPCSGEHIALMRSQTINTPAVEEIGYFENGLLKCTSWGVTTQHVEGLPADFTTPDGLGVVLRVTPDASLGQQTTAVAMGSYNVLITPSYFIDLVIDDEIAIALLNDRGEIISMRNNPDRDLVASLAANEKSGIYASSLAGVAQSDGLSAVVIEPRARLVPRLWQELIVFLPAGALLSLLLLCAVFWLSKRRLSLRAELDLAISKREFMVHYQPIVDLKTGICVGAEALVRWKRPDGSLVRPDLFIPLAEETGQIAPITDLVIDAVIADMSSFLAGDRTLHIAINVCSSDIQSGRIVDLVAEKLDRTDIRKEQIWLEATERGFLDVNSASHTLERARKAGHSIAIDDFGTGYSSLQYLQTLPLDALKIDKSFVDTIGTQAATSSVILHIIELAHALGLFSVAEGVETEEQAAFLKERGVHFAQGWLFSKPLPAVDFMRYHIEIKQSRGAAPEILSAGKHALSANKA